ncbi:MAG: type II secretion system major pseudopilin GspG [Planctomycetes bacterium]|nr:type II secretion system major pseudopilin GspG [Planctomycetota bacterium]
MGRKSKRRAGFTLIELMVVVVIIGLLAAATVLVVTDRLDKAKVKTTQATVKELATAVGFFQMDHGRYPDKLEDLVRMPAYAKAENWPKSGRYLDSVPKDGWDRDFIYRAPGTNGAPYDILSYGEDGREGGDGLNADLWNHDAGKR